RYGQDGDLIKLRKSLVKPIQDQIWIAVKTVAERRNYGFVFDKGSDLIMVYTDPRFDISREVLLQLNPNALDNSNTSSSNSGSSGRANTSNNRNSNTSSKNQTQQKQTQQKQQQQIGTGAKSR